MIKDFNITSNTYINTKPYPYMYIDNVLDENFANILQKEILDIPDTEFDTYNNPFEKKLTLRNKNNFPTNLQLLMNYLISEEFINKLSLLTGYKLIPDEHKHYYGIHKYFSGGKLDIHLDAGIHPKNELKKQVTLGIYLSSNWNNSYGGELEIWEGNTNSIHKCVEKIEPKFNRMIIFTCNDISWHGNPNIIKCPEDACRIFITMSYLSNNFSDSNKLKRALFVANPNDDNSTTLDELRIRRSNNELCHTVYTADLISK